MWNELWQAIRRLALNPWPAVITALTLGIGLGAAAAILTVAWSALIEPLPYTDSDELVHLWEIRSGTDERSPTSYPTFVDWRRESNGFSGLEGYDPANFTIGVGDETRMLRGAQVTDGFFRLLGVGMSAGRDLDSNDPSTGETAIAVVTADVANSLGAQSPLGQTINVNGTPHQVIGVLPSSFHFALLQDAKIFVPLTVSDRQRSDRSQRFIRVIGRLREGKTLRSAADQLSSLMTELSATYPNSLKGRTAVGVPLRDALLGNVKPIVMNLLLTMVLLLAIATSNLVLLTLTRLVDRAPELKIRSTLGATRGRLLSQLMAESLLPGVAGAILAIAVGQIASRHIFAAIPPDVRIGMPYFANGGLLPEAIVATLVLSVLLTSLFSGMSAFLGTRNQERAAGSRLTRGRHARKLRRGLVAAQVAVSVVLLMSSVLLTVSFHNLIVRDTGFRNPETLVSIRVPLSGQRYQSADSQRAFYETLLVGASSLPGVRNAALINEVPGSGGGMTSFESVDSPLPAPMRPQAAVRITGGDYFQTMGIPIVRGRTFGSGDRPDSQPVAVVSESFARHLADDSGFELGRRIHLAATGGQEWEVIGVVRDAQITPMDSDSPPTVYLSNIQAQENRMTIVLRTAIGAAVMENQVRSLVKKLDPGIPVYAAAEMDQQLMNSRAVFSRRLPMILISVFAGAALALSIIALYATSANEVLARRRELGIRAALGASPTMLWRQMLSGGFRVGVGGISAGVLGAMVVSRVIQPMLFRVPAIDWRIYTAVVTGTLLVVLFSNLVPATRAASVAPSEALRTE